MLPAKGLEIQVRSPVINYLIRPLSFRFHPDFSTQIPSTNGKKLCPNPIGREHFLEIRFPAFTYLKPTHYHEP